MQFFLHLMPQSSNRVSLERYSYSQSQLIQVYFASVIERPLKGWSLHRIV